MPPGDSAARSGSSWWRHLDLWDDVLHREATATLPFLDEQYSLEAPELYANFEGWNARLCEAQAYDGTHHCWRVWLGHPGEVEHLEGPVSALSNSRMQPAGR